jgi:Leucine-rich repeat (LRR) protein
LVPAKSSAESAWFQLGYNEQLLSFGSNFNVRHYIGGLPTLETLALTHNRLSSVPAELGEAVQSQPHYKAPGFSAGY